VEHRIGIIKFFWLARTGGFSTANNLCTSVSDLCASSDVKGNCLTCYKGYYLKDRSSRMDSECSLPPKMLTLLILDAEYGAGISSLSFLFKDMILQPTSNVFPSIITVIPTIRMAPANRTIKAMN
jgi:hypothetical protein